MTDKYAIGCFIFEGYKFCKLEINFTKQLSDSMIKSHNRSNFDRINFTVFKKYIRENYGLQKRVPYGRHFTSHRIHGYLPTSALL